MTNPKDYAAELERDAHRMLLELINNGQRTHDPEHIATRVLMARADVSASMREQYVDVLAEAIRKQMEHPSRSNPP